MNEGSSCEDTSVRRASSGGSDEKADAVEEIDLDRQDPLESVLLKLRETVSEMKAPKKRPGVEAVLGSFSASTSAGDAAGILAQLGLHDAMCKLGLCAHRGRGLFWR